MSLRSSFTIMFFGFPFADFFLSLFLYFLGVPIEACGIVFLVVFVVCSILIGKIKCPNCKTKLKDSFNIFSRYYRGGFHSIPKNCPCCGQDLDEV